MPHYQPHIYRQHLLAGLLALALASNVSNVLAFGTQDDQLQTSLASEFRKLDRNSNGKLSREEARRDDDIAHHFDQADTNHDGTLSTKEYGNFKSPVQRAKLEAYLDDSSVTAKIKAELLKNSGISGLAISVQTYRGRVILSGFVDTAQQARRAVEITSGIRGVHRITNSLLLKKAEGAEAQAPGAPAAACPALAANIINGRYIYPNTQFGEAHLTMYILDKTAIPTTSWHRTLRPMGQGTDNSPPAIERRCHEQL